MSRLAASRSGPFNKFSVENELPGSGTTVGGSAGATVSSSEPDCSRKTSLNTGTESSSSKAPTFVLGSWYLLNLHNNPFDKLFKAFSFKSCQVGRPSA